KVAAQGENPPSSLSIFPFKVTWQKLVNGTKQNVAIANPSLGLSVASPYTDRVTFKNAAVRRRTPNLEDTTICFSSLRLSDDATYICEYTTFPAGNRENTVNLTVYGKDSVHPTPVARSSNLKTPVATCISANGKPPGTIRWETRVPGEVTVQSDYILVPSRETHREILACVTMYNEEVYTESVTLDIQCKSGSHNRRNVQLICRADANPPVSLYQWRLINGSISSNIEIRDNVLLFKGPVTYDLIGTRSASVEIVNVLISFCLCVGVLEKPLPQIATGDVISVIASLLAAGVLMGVTVTVLVLKIRSRREKPYVNLII
uniref:Nectin cell adhesion molecule 1a n=1 Tax=Nothobranchius furzeri TaxID=105023 RepID=A0A8C6KLI7_NOTFU